MFNKTSPEICGLANHGVKKCDHVIYHLHGNHITHITSQFSSHADLWLLRYQWGTDASQQCAALGGAFLGHQDMVVSPWILVSETSQRGKL
jgi:hypothetical protein